MNDRQTLFVSEYLKDFNATRAAKAAGYSQRSAYSIGQENLKKPEIAEAIKVELAKKCMGPDETLQRITDIARGDMADLMAVSTSGFSFNLLLEDDAGNKFVNPNTKLIKKIRQKVTTFLAKKESDEDREVIDTELELYSAAEALALLAKHHGLLIDRTEISGPNGGAIPVETFANNLKKVYGPEEPRDVHKDS